MFQLNLTGSVLLAMVVASVIAFLSTPIVRAVGVRVGAVDVPKDARRMHKVPIPTLGGLAIFLGFIMAVLLFAEVDSSLRGILLGAVLLVVLGVVDDLMDLNAMLKFVVQIVAASLAVAHGCVIQIISNPNFFSSALYVNLGVLSAPLTIIWIVAIVNAVNFIDGLDGLAAGVSAISAGTMLVIAMLVSEANVAVIVAALLGACLGFLPYNLNPAKIFMGDTGATFLGYIMATISVQGLFKSYAIISFAVPFLILGVPIFDICFAFLRRIARGQSPMVSDREHVHHRLIDMGLNQKQAVAIIYFITGILGLSAVVLTTSGELKAMIFIVACCIVGAVALKVIFHHDHSQQPQQHPQAEETAQMQEEDGQNEEA